MCSLESTVWLARHMAGEHLCPKDGEGWIFIAFIAYMVFGSYHAHRYKDYLGDGEVKKRLSKVIRECREEAEEKKKDGSTGGYMSSVMHERTGVTKVRHKQSPPRPDFQGVSERLLVVAAGGEAAADGFREG